jgi:hypothetical protein
MSNEETTTPGRMRMARLRAAIADHRRTSTPGDYKGNRTIATTALQLLAPTSPLCAKIAACGKRNPANDSRVFCEHPGCGVCMNRRAEWLFDERIWPALEATPPDRLRWVTVLMFEREDLDKGGREMDRQLRRLRHVLKKFDGGEHDVRVWGAREVERDGAAWLFHVHLLIDLGTASADDLARMLRDVWGRGERQVQVKTLKPRNHRLNIRRLTEYMTKARLTETVDGRRIWMSYANILTLVMWRDRMPAQWHRFTWGVRGEG